MPGRGGLARASPLFFRIVRLAGSEARYAVLMGLFRSRFLPDDEILVKPGDFSQRTARAEVPADFGLIERWFDYVRADGKGTLSVDIV
jgi:hypothetical protein